MGSHNPLRSETRRGDIRNRALHSFNLTVTVTEFQGFILITSGVLSGLYCLVSLSCLSLCLCPPYTVD